MRKVIASGSHVISKHSINAKEWKSALTSWRSEQVYSLYHIEIHRYTAFNERSQHIAHSRNRKRYLFIMLMRTYSQIWPVISQLTKLLIYFLSKFQQLCSQRTKFWTIDRMQIRTNRVCEVSLVHLIT